MTKMISERIIEIDNVAVRREILEVKFACDLQKCHGACCTLESQFGAPVKKEEIVELENILHEVFNFIPDIHREEIIQNGFWENKEGELMIRSLNSRDCVFSFKENNIAKCGIEKAYFEGKIKFRKPISCHLFPIRISDFGGDILRFEKFNECQPALENGMKTETTIAEFCRESLIRQYGKQWYEKLMPFLRS